MSSEKEQQDLESKTARIFDTSMNQQQQHEAGSSSSKLPPSYSLSGSLLVPAKGKLILPTALWALLILAGVCFLFLLGSLSKSIRTLDTIVELELDRSAKAHQEAEHLRSLNGGSTYHHGAPSRPERLEAGDGRTKATATRDDEHDDDDEPKSKQATKLIGLSLGDPFSLFDEASISRHTQKNEAAEMEAAIKSIVDDMLLPQAPGFELNSRPLNGGAGRIVVSSGIMGPASLPMSPFGLMGASLRGGPLEPRRVSLGPFAPGFLGPNLHSDPDSPGADSDSAPSVHISAKIDNVYVNGQPTHANKNNKMRNEDDDEQRNQDEDGDTIVTLKRIKSKDVGPREKDEDPLLDRILINLIESISRSNSNSNSNANKHADEQKDAIDPSSGAVDPLGVMSMLFPNNDNLQNSLDQPRVHRISLASSPGDHGHSPPHQSQPTTRLSGSKLDHLLGMPFVASPADSLLFGDERPRIPPYEFVPSLSPLEKQKSRIDAELESITKDFMDSIHKLDGLNVDQQIGPKDAAKSNFKLNLDDAREPSPIDDSIVLFPSDLSIGKQHGQSLSSDQLNPNTRATLANPNNAFHHIFQLFFGSPPSGDNSNKSPSLTNRLSSSPFVDELDDSSKGKAKSSTSSGPTKTMDHLFSLHEPDANKESGSIIDRDKMKPATTEQPKKQQIDSFVDALFDDILPSAAQTSGDKSGAKVEADKTKESITCQCEKSPAGGAGSGAAGSAGTKAPAAGAPPAGGSSGAAGAKAPAGSSPSGGASSSPSGAANAKPPPAGSGSSSGASPSGSSAAAGAKPPSGGASNSSSPASASGGTSKPAAGGASSGSGNAPKPLGPIGLVIGPGTPNQPSGGSSSRALVGNPNQVMYANHNQQSQLQRGPRFELAYQTSGTSSNATKPNATTMAFPWPGFLRNGTKPCNKTSKIPPGAKPPSLVRPMILTRA